MSSPYPAPHPGARRTTLVLVTLAVLAALVVGGGCVALIAATARSTTAARPAAENFLALLEKRDYAGALGQMTAETRAGKSSDEMKDVAALLEKRRGKMTGHQGPRNFSARTFNGVTQVQFAYAAKFEKGEVPVTLTLVRQNGEWRVLAYNFQL